MLRYIFKPKDSRVFRGRYRIGSDAKIYDVPLHTDKRHVAEAELRQLVKELEEEKLGLIKPRALRDATRIPLLEHAADFIADITARGRCRNHISHTKSRLQRLFAECGWNLIHDISADNFIKWRTRQTFSPKTANEYLGHANALFNWMERNERLERNPLKSVGKSETRGKERYVRRALTTTELATLIQSSGKRALPYMLAAYTGLRRGEIKQLVWDDVHLDEERPYILARASTTKNKKTAVLPLVPQLVQMLKDWREQQHTLIGTVFKRSVPTAVTLLKDLAACGIKGVDENGRHLDFHALRHTFATMLANAGISPRVAMELMRHSDMRLTAKTYTDVMNLPLFTESGNGPGQSGSFAVQQDGSYVAQFPTTSRMVVTHEGTFQVINGYLIISVTKSSLTDQVVPRDFRYRIVRANAREIVIDDGEKGGQVFRKDTK